MAAILRAHLALDPALPRSTPRRRRPIGFCARLRARSEVGFGGGLPDYLPALPKFVRDFWHGLACILRRHGVRFWRNPMVLRGGTLLSPVGGMSKFQVRSSSRPAAWWARVIRAAAPTLVSSAARTKTQCPLIAGTKKSGRAVDLPSRDPGVRHSRQMSNSRTADAARAVSEVTWALRRYISCLLCALEDDPGLHAV